MCGLAGFLDLTRSTAREAMAARVEAMSRALTHRGPDDSGRFIAEDAGLALGFRRLAIIDLSEAGHQPMTSADGRWTVSYNGEIYNYKALRADLESTGVRFRGHSDTEVMLEHVARHGPLATVEKLVGMFAIALWDSRERQLWLFRDRLGIKPLYHGRQGDLILWGSELKALAAHPDWRPEVDRKAVGRYLQFNRVPAPRTIYRGVEKLGAGHWLRIDAGDGTRTGGRYWRLEDAIDGPRDLHDPQEAVERLHARLREAVSCRMVADVPLGALLSGGIDSSTVVALMAEASGRPIKTFTIGFDNQGFDEAAHAKQVAAHLRTDHTELYLAPRIARDLIPDLPDWYDEPFADSSALPTYLVSKLAREQVTVALSGDGGDEAFLGYNRHLALARLARLDHLPAGFRRLTARAIEALGTGGVERLASLLPKSKRPRQAADKALKLARALAQPDTDHRYLDLISHWRAEDGLVPEGEPGELPPTTLPRGLDPAARAAAYDTLGYLPDDILTKVDRASMAVGLEARVPLLDHRVVELAWRMPTSVRMKGGIGKWPLRRILYRYVPQHLVERPKAGFAIPLGEWLRDPLREWAEELLSERRLKQRGLVDPAPVRAAWADHLKGTGQGRAEALWNILMLESWAERWLDR
ncbi:asparagine synthase (glutamine-hydrolyzing) [Marivibrio halodurans]|uniref:asparagine synthase (glutamine-hydrolyzing) n=1 Tax=Marivibrio halodurans TaxID=2039722 RepID=A0A8J7S0C2_9PROT|nr:asparagine synthase (glutamine-hydrolyzing) [Marivibrio halodurans]MBP5857560.1 asparagine synthase (glutamine-hydrolyzing) [Marivibrio halodurans]